MAAIAQVVDFDALGSVRERLSTARRVLFYIDALGLVDLLEIGDENLVGRLLDRSAVHTHFAMGFAG